MDCNYIHNLDTNAIEDKRVVISLLNFQALLEYNTTLPTGTTVGKIWRALYTEGYFLGEYINDPSPTQVGIKWREIWIRYAGEAVRATHDAVKEIALATDTEKRLAK